METVAVKSKENTDHLPGVLLSERSHPAECTSRMKFRDRQSDPMVIEVGTVATFGIAIEISNED